MQAGACACLQAEDGHVQQRRGCPSECVWMALLCSLPAGQSAHCVAHSGRRGAELRSPSKELRSNSRQVSRALCTYACMYMYVISHTSACFVACLSDVWGMRCIPYSFPKSFRSMSSSVPVSKGSGEFCMPQVRQACLCVSTGPGGLNRQACRLCRGACRLCRGACRLCREACRLCRGACRLCRGACRLCRGACRLCREACRLCREACRLCRGACRLCRGACRLCRGARRLGRGACRLCRGACRLCRGACRLCREACRLCRGACRLTEQARWESQVGVHSLLLPAFAVCSKNQVEACTSAGSMQH